METRKLQVKRYYFQLLLNDIEVRDIYKYVDVNRTKKLVYHVGKSWYFFTKEMNHYDALVLKRLLSRIYNYVICIKLTKRDSLYQQNIYSIRNIEPLK